VTPEEQAAETVQLAEAAKQSRTYTAEEFKELVAQRDEVKKKLREREDADKKAADAKLLEEGKLKEALEAKDRELSEYKDIKGKLKRFEDAEAARKEKLLKSLPEKKRELYAGVDVSVLEDIVNEFAAEKPPKGSKAGTTEGITNFRDMTELERQELKKTNPSKWWEEFSHYWKEKNGSGPPISYKPQG